MRSATVPHDSCRQTRAGLGCDECAYRAARLHAQGLSLCFVLLWEKSWARTPFSSGKLRLPISSPPNQTHCALLPIPNRPLFCVSVSASGNNRHLSGPPFSRVVPVPFRFHTAFQSDLKKNKQTKDFFFFFKSSCFTFTAKLPRKPTQRG